MSDWHDPEIREATQAVRDALRGNLQSDHTVASSLKSLSGALGKGEFIKFTMDTDVGLAVTSATAYKFARMVSVVTLIPTKKVWTKIGWDGTSKIAKIEDRNERVAVCRAVTRSKRPLGRQRLLDIVETHAPAHTKKRARKSTSGVTQARAVRDLDTLKTAMTTWIAKYSVLKLDMTEEVEVILGLGSDLPGRS